jgi:hypothetical protein
LISAKSTFSFSEIRSAQAPIKCGALSYFSLLPFGFGCAKIFEAVKGKIRKAVLTMAERKTPEQQLEALEKKMEQLKAQKKAIQAKQNKIERAQRTRRLIENGALAEKYLNCEKIEPAEFEKLLKQLVQIEQVKALVSAPKNGGVNE